IYDHARHLLHRKVERTACPPQMLYGAASTAGKAEVVANDELPHVHGMNQQLTDECVRGHAAHAVVKPRAEEDVDSRFRQYLEFFAKSGKSRRRARCCKELLRRRLEAHHDRWQPLAFRLLQDLIQKLLVTEMQTVVRTYRRDTAGCDKLERKIACGAN